MLSDITGVLADRLVPTLEFFNDLEMKRAGVEKTLKITRTKPLELAPDINGKAEEIAGGMFTTAMVSGFVASA